MNEYKREEITFSVEGIDNCWASVTWVNNMLTNATIEFYGVRIYLGEVKENVLLYIKNLKLLLEELERRVQ